MRHPGSSACGEVGAVYPQDRAQSRANPRFPEHQNEGFMAKGREEHEAKVAHLNSFGRELARRSKSKCELCEKAGEKLGIFVLPPEPKVPDIDRCLLLCESCRDQAGEVKRFKAGEHWRVLVKTAWSPVPMAQVLAVRLLRRQANSQPWAREALDLLYLDDEIEELVTEGE